MGSFHVWEVMSDLNKRTSLGRVVINPPQKMPPLSLKKGAEKWFLCKCGRGFVDRRKYFEHKKTHPKHFSVDWTPKPNQLDRVIEGTMHSCMHCGKVLQTATALRNHIYIHTGEKPWQCDKCPAVFRLYSTLYDHRRVSHVVGGKFKCPQCPCRFQAHLGLKRHVGIYHAKISLGTAGLTKNNKLMAKGKAAQQVVKGRITTTVLSTDGTRTYPCDYCGKVFYKSQYLRNHLPVHTGERRSVCHLCGVGFKSSSNLLAHKKVSHVEGGKHKCERCTCVFASLLGLVRHRRLLHGIGKAPMMKRKFKKAKLVKAPMHFLAAFATDGFEDDEEMEEEEEEEEEEEQQEEEAAAEDSFECEECGKVLASAAGLRNHLMIHSGEKPWICNICGLSFRLNSTLYGHKKSSHVPNGPFKCDICPCSFAAQFGLRRHKICFHDAAETTVEPIRAVKSSKCQYCKKVFKSMNILQQHIQLVHRSEDLERPVKCPKCDCAYTTARSLRKHTKTAHVPGGKKCPKCPCAFSTSQARKAHHTKMHVKPNLISLKRPVAASNGDRNAEISNASSKLNAASPLPCDRCNKLFFSEASLKGHQRYCSQQNIQCDLCDESFSIHSNMIRHKRSCHVPNGQYKCNQCSHCYATTRGISRHMAHAHGVYSRERNRTTYGSVISSKKVLPALQMKPTLAIHRIIQNSKMREMRKRKPYQRVPDILRKHKCLLCGNAFSSNGNYKKHMQTSHVPGGKYPCSKCSCVFNTYNALNSHVGNRHSSRKSLNENLQMSTKMISQKRPASTSPHKPSIPTLSKIKFNFFRPSTSLPVPSPSPPVSPPHSAVIKRKPSELLKRMALIVGGNTAHESSPEPETPTPPRIASPKVEMKVLPVPFTTPSGIPKCDVCGKIYSNMATLRNHLTVHTGEKPFPCDQCGQRFRQKGDVVSHKRTNHSDGKYKCGLCPCRFISTQGYKRHMAQIHENAKSQAQVQQTKVVPSVVKPTRGQPLASIMKPEKKEPVEYGKVTLAFASEKPEVSSPKDGRKFSCELCDASFNHIQNLLRHRKSSHVPWGEYKCSLCSCSFVSPTSLRTHQAIFHHSDKKGGKHAGLPGKPKRERAPLPSSTQSSLDVGEADEDSDDIRAPKIIKNTRGKKTFLCQMCGATFNSYGNSTKHITNSHVDNGSYPCRKCPCIFASFKGLTRHESIYHTGGNKGAKKQIVTQVKRELKRVEEREGDEGTNNYEDDSSDREEERSPEIYDNNFEDEEECLLIRGNESNEIDPLDTSSSQDDDNQSDDHILTPKIEATSLAQQQEEDSDPFLEPDIMDLQARIPSITVTKVADTNSKLEKIPPRPHGTVFGDVGVLQKERINRFAIYAKKDQHVCDICNMKFSQLGSLKGHMRIHTGDKPYQCRYCGICFRLNGTLATHVKKCHHEANPYQCEYCSCQFVTSGVLTQHIYKYHPEKAESLDEA